MNLIDAAKSVEKPYLEHFKNHYFLILEKIFTNDSAT
jgi:hypothetical protein